MGKQQLEARLKAAQLNQPMDTGQHTGIDGEDLAHKSVVAETASVQATGRYDRPAYATA